MFTEIDRNMNRYKFRNCNIFLAKAERNRDNNYFSTNPCD